LVFFKKKNPPNPKGKGEYEVLCFSKNDLS